MIVTTIPTEPAGTIGNPAATGAAERRVLLDEILAGTAVIAGHQRGAVARRLHRQGISMAHLQTLWILQEHGPLPISRLADLLGVADPNATGIIDRMEQRGLVERLRDGADRRVVIVSQTPDGARAVEEIDGWRSEMFEALLQRLDTDQLSRLVGGIKELREAIVEHGTDLPTSEARRGPETETATP